MRKAVWLVTFVATASLVRAQGRDFDKVEIKVEKAAGSVYMLTGAGGNIAISVGEDGVLVVDDQFAPLVPKIRAAIKGVTDKPVRFVLNTHWHGDHTGGNAAFASDSTIIAHDNVRARLEAGAANVAGRSVPPAPKEALPVITFDHELSVHLNGEEIRALHYAKGHTDGDVVIHFTKSNVVHMGDDFVTYGLPFVDVASGGSLLGLIENVEKAMAAVPDDVKIIPGHGALSTKADVARYTAMLRDCVTLVRAARQQGKSLEQMKTEGVLAKYDSQGQGFVKTAPFVELIDNELKGEIAGTKQPSVRHH